MPTISIGELRQSISECLEQVKDYRERIVVTKHNHPVAAIVSLEDLLLLERISQQIEKVIAQAIVEGQAGEATIPWNEAKERLDAIMAAKREKIQASDPAGKTDHTLEFSVAEADGLSPETRHAEIVRHTLSTSRLIALSSKSR
jgi:prevent-host-death family protein